MIMMGMQNKQQCIVWGPQSAMEEVITALEKILDSFHSSEGLNDVA